MVGAVSAGERTAKARWLVGKSLTQHELLDHGLAPALRGHIRQQLAPVVDAPDFLGEFVELLLHLTQTICRGQVCHHRDLELRLAHRVRPERFPCFQFLAKAFYLVFRVRILSTCKEEVLDTLAILPPGDLGFENLHCLIAKNVNRGLELTLAVLSEAQVDLTRI